MLTLYPTVSKGGRAVYVHKISGTRGEENALYQKNSLLLFVSGTEEEDNSQCELLSVQISSATLNSFAFSTTSGKKLKNVPCKKQFFRYIYYGETRPYNLLVSMGNPGVAAVVVNKDTGVYFLQQIDVFAKTYVSMRNDKFLYMIQPE